MEVSDRLKQEITKRIMISRMRILSRNGFYGLLLMNMRISLSDKYETAWTDCNEWICFNPEFVVKLSDRELDFVFMHEIVHVVLQHALRIGTRDKDIYNIAADVVANSNIMHSNNDDESSITLKEFGVSMHIAPDGSEGYLHTVEEVYNMLLSREPGGQGNNKDSEDGKSRNGNGNRSDLNNGYESGWDVHEFSELSEEQAEKIRIKWESNLRKACESMAARDPGNKQGSIPMFAKRLMDELTTPQIDWRQLLVEFIQEEVNDYSFMPPDKRLADNPFFLPDFNDKVEKVDKILFMVDTSGSMSVEMVTRCYSEIKGAIDQFDGRLQGFLGFFDSEVTEPLPFEDTEEFFKIEPVGGGGTNFHAIFSYVEEKMSVDPPLSIVILTDGFAEFPEESAAGGIPVMWIINNENVTPPWGVVARIK